MGKGFIPHQMAHWLCIPAVCMLYSIFPVFSVYPGGSIYICYTVQMLIFYPKENLTRACRPASRSVRPWNFWLSVVYFRILQKLFLFLFFKICYKNEDVFLSKMIYGYFSSIILWMQLSKSKCEVCIPYTFAICLMLFPSFSENTGKPI